ncbi:hypothetical protein C8R44DRAFT_894721 [Mycena epipterygia]|nr:hypothetical protein C8R44DRAFT_894721 [Mycena epipterygia]
MPRPTPATTIHMRPVTTSLAGRGILLLAFLLFLNAHGAFLSAGTRDTRAIPVQCRAIRTQLDPPPGFNASHTMEGSDRFVSRPRATLVRNAMILTSARNGTEVIYGDGVVAILGYIPAPSCFQTTSKLSMPEGNWYHPVSSTRMDFAARTTSAPTTSISAGDSGRSGGSAGCRGARLTLAAGAPHQTATHQQTLDLCHDRRAALMLFLNNIDQRTKWRHIKHACGENLDQLYGQMPMDAA